ncbi:hypothetical protein ACFW1P_24255 [Paenibacillus sp. NPDC058910]|uniref:hypothetical protein n=1 Tax=Paenibacillus sp. NPDC058910 TaxID=3346670 RepID=UPI00369F7053
MRFAKSTLHTAHGGRLSMLAKFNDGDSLISSTVTNSFHGRLAARNHIGIGSNHFKLMR